MSSPARKSVYKGPMTHGLMSIPVAIYKAKDCYELPGSLYHVDCHGKVRQELFCEEHPGEEEIATFSGVIVSNEVVPLDSVMKDQLLGRKDQLEILSSHRLADLPLYISTTCLVPCELYELTGQRNSDLPVNSDGSHDALATLLERLRVKKKFLRLKLGLGGLSRHAILLPNGYLYTLAYEEEMRDKLGVTGNINRYMGKLYDDMIESIEERHFYQPSLAEIDTRVTNWVVGMARRIVAARKKNKKGKKVLTNA
jgi:non-homologous end joining protein Ku